MEVQGTLRRVARLPVVSFTIAGLDPAEIGLRLDEEFGIAARVGLHCAPAAHRTMGTFPTGTVRFSLGAFTTADDVDYAVRAVRGRCARVAARRERGCGRAAGDRGPAPSDPTDRCGR